MSTPRRDVAMDSHEAVRTRRNALGSRVHQRLIDEMNQFGTLPDIAVRQRIHDIVGEIVLEQDMLSVADQQSVARMVTHDVLGLGPLEELRADPTISEIMVNGREQIFVERNGRIERSHVVFESDAQLMQVIDRIVRSVGRRIDESSAMVDARLADGSRVNVVIPPLALSGPTITIRRFGADVLRIGEFVSQGALTEEMVCFLAACVRARLNIVVSGGAGSGKTTLLNMLSAFCADHERIVTIEDAAELQLRQRHVVPLESRPHNVEGRGQVSIRDLLINALRMRPDRIIIGECRGAETIDMLQAMNTGHDGSLTTLHANSPQDALTRLETMALMGSQGLPSSAVREQIAAAVQIVVQVAKLRDGSRRVTSISEVIGMVDGRPSVQELFHLTTAAANAQGRIEGEHHATGTEPRNLERIMRDNGGRLPHFGDLDDAPVNWDAVAEAEDEDEDEDDQNEDDQGGVRAPRFILGDGVLVGGDLTEALVG